MADTGCSTPEEGDLIIRRDVCEGEAVYVLHLAQGADQYMLRTRGEAIAQATHFAKRQRVRVWVTDGDSNWALIENFRIAR